MRALTSHSFKHRTIVQGAALLLCLGGGQGAYAVTDVFIGGGYYPNSWGEDINWSQSATPEAYDDVWIGLLPDGVTPATVGYAANNYPYPDPSPIIRNLNIRQGAELNVNQGSLTVTGTTSIDSATMNIDDANSPVFTTDTLTTTGNSDIHLRNTLAIGDSATIGPNSTLYAWGSSPTIELESGATSFVNEGTLSVDYDTTITALGGTVQLGALSSSVVDIDNGDTLTVNGAMAGSFAGYMNLNGATLSLSSDWNSSGQIDTRSDATIQASTFTLSGTGSFDVLDLSGPCIGGCTGVSDVTIDTDLVVNDSAAINVTHNNALTFTGDATFNGGSLTVEYGALTLEGNVTFSSDSDLTLGAVGDTDLVIGGNADVTINQSEFDLHQTNLIMQDGASLTINTDDTNSDGFERPAYVAGTLNINSLTPDTLDKVRITTQIHTNEGTDQARTSTVINGVKLDVYNRVAGRFEAHPYSDLQINSPLNFVSSLNETRKTGLWVYDDATCELTGDTNFGTYTTVRIEPDGVLTLSVASPDDVTIFHNSAVKGGGTLVVSQGTRFSVSGDGTEFDVDITNQGTLEPIGSTNRKLTLGTTTGDRAYTQTSAGSLELTIDGAPNDIDNYDSIDFYGDVSLAGALSVDDSTYTMAAGDTYRIIEQLSATGSLTGAFDSVTGLPAYSSSASEMTGLWYDNAGGTVDILTVISGDLNGNGYVGLDDVQLILDNWNENVPVLAYNMGDVNGDGYVGLDDLQSVQDHWNNGTPPSTTDVAVPEPASLALLGLGGLAVLRRRAGR